MPKKLNVRVLLKNTEYADQADELANKIEGWGMDNDYDIHNLASHGMIGTINPNVLVQTILEQDAKSPEESKAEKEEPDWLRATSAAAELAAEHDIDLSEIDGTGRDGTIVKTDVQLLL